MMQTTRMLFLGILMFFGLVCEGQAQERREFYNGARALGMGGVVVPTVNDETALISNPAALGRLRGPILTIADPEWDMSSTGPGILTKDNGTDLFAFNDPQKFLDRLNLSPDKYMHAGGHLFPSFVTTNFGIGVHANYQTDGEVVTDPTPSQFNYFYRQDLALLLGVNFRFWDGRIKIGFSGKAINRAEVDRSLPANSTGLQFKDLVKEGGAIAGDAGLILTAPWAWLPSIAAVYRDVGGTNFDLNDGLLYDSTQRPNYVRPSMDAGFSVSPILGKKTRLVIAGEIRDVQTLSDEADKMKRYHAGLELNISDTLYLRGGMNQRYWTGGVEFSMPYIQLQFASYGEEIGVSTAAQVKTREDRRYIGKIAIRF